MNAQRVAGVTALVAGTALVALLIIGAFAGPTLLAWTGSDQSASTDPMMNAHHAGGGMAMMDLATAPTAIPDAREVRVQAKNFGFTPSEIHVAKNQALNLTLTNPTDTGVVHDLSVPALSIHIAASPGSAATIGLRDLPAGRYDGYCSVPGHAELGMRAVVIVE